jgi:hypothetical protein
MPQAKQYIPFSALPNCKEMITEIVFDTCAKSILRMRMIRILKQGDRVQPEDSVWIVEDPFLPNRYIRLFSGLKSVQHLVKSYGFMDSNECVNYKSGKLGVGTMKPCAHIPLLERISATRGVPQRTLNSGICWFSATCFATLFSEPLRSLVLERLDADASRIASNLLSNSSDSETFRRILFDKYGFGDDPDQDPLKDGKNGFTEFTTLAAQLDIPLVRLFAPDMIELTDKVTDQKGREHSVRNEPRNDEYGILAVRCFRTKWTPRRRLNYKGRRYRLISVLIGSEQCGHQIGASTCDGRVCRWSVSDSDQIRYGIGPLFWSLKRLNEETKHNFRKRWWDAFASMIPVTMMPGQNMCDSSPHNRSTNSLKFKEPTDDRPGVVNSDFIYVSDPVHRTLV